MRLKAGTRIRTLVTLGVLSVLAAGCQSEQYLVPASQRAGLTPALQSYQQSADVHDTALSQQLDQAIQAEEVVVSQDSTYAPGYEKLGGLFWHAGQFEAALQAFRRASQIAPRNAADWVAMGQAEARLGHTVKAAQAFRRALTVNPGSWLAWDGLGFLSVSGHAWRQAWRDAEAALTAGGQEAPTMDLMGRVLYGQGDANDALTYFTDAEELESTWWQSYYDAGRAELALGNRSSALKDLNRATALNPGAGQAWQLAQTVKGGQ